MGGGAGVDHQSFGVADIGQMACQLHGFDKGAPGIAAPLIPQAMIEPWPFGMSRIAVS